MIARCRGTGLVSLGDGVKGVRNCRGCSDCKRERVLTEAEVRLVVRNEVSKMLAEGQVSRGSGR